MEENAKGISQTFEPKVFISYSWTTQLHKDRVLEWADRLLFDGVDVEIDIYSLQDGQDTYAFMEKMVTDPSVTNVLIFSDCEYAGKADARIRGVGVESQIISKEVYDEVGQTKFIPIVCEFRDDGTACLPTFLKSRFWIDFSSLEKVNENWERLVRNLFRKPQYEKPKVGEPPAYLRATSTPSSPATYKYDQLRRSILEEQPSLSLYRKEFLDACIEFASELRVRERPEVENFGEKVLEDCRKLVPVRDHVVDWVLLESVVAPSQSFSDALTDLLERFRELAARPEELNAWNESWFEAHRLFVYETFLYIIASLLKARAFEDLNNVFTSHFLLPSAERHGGIHFMRFDGLWTHSDLLNSVLSTEGRRYLSPAAEVVKRQANREDMPFPDLIQADLLALLMSFIPPRANWYPQLMHYSRYGGEFPFFIRASQHKNFANLATVTGIADADDLRAKVRQGLQQLGEMGLHSFSRGRVPDIWDSLNMDNLDILK